MPPTPLNICNNMYQNRRPSPLRIFLVILNIIFKLDIENGNFIFQELGMRKLIIFSSLFFIYICSSSLAKAVDIENQLLNRKEISKVDLKNKILKNKNVDFNKLMNLKIYLDKSEVNCFFGYQDDSRIVLCY